MRCRNHSLDLQLITGFCSATSYGIGTNERTCLIREAERQIGQAEVVRRLDAAVAPLRRPWSEAVHSGPATVRHPIIVAGYRHRLFLPPIPRPTPAPKSPPPQFPCHTPVALLLPQ